MESTKEEMRSHPAGESEEEEFDGFSFEKKPSPRAYHPESLIDYESQFQREIAAGNIKGVKNAFNNGTLLNVIDKIHRGGYNGLMIACSLGHWDIVAFLLEIGADPNFNNVDLFTPLIAVCFSFSSDEVNLSRCARLLYEKGADLNAVDTSGTSSLMYACKYGHFGLVHDLLKMGAKLNLQDNKGWTALFWAVNKGFVESVQMLLKAGAKKKIKDKYDKTAYSLALSKNVKENILDALNPKRCEKKKLATKEVKKAIGCEFADWTARLNRFVSSDTTPKYKGMKLNVFQFLTATDDELITLGMEYFWQRKQTLIFIKNYHMQPWVRFKLGEKPNHNMRLAHGAPDLTYTTAANKVLALHDRLVIVQASVVFLSRQCDGENIHNDAKMIELVRMCSFGLNDLMNDLQNMLKSLEKSDKSLVCPADFIMPLALYEKKSKLPAIITLSAVICVGAFVFWKSSANTQ